ncbi:hypothetical protein EDC01DRAFT_592052, partial [Geopyxis carbonaria]
RTVRRVRVHFRTTGNVVPPRSAKPQGRRRLYSRDATALLLGILKARPDSFLDELQDIILERHPLQNAAGTGVCCISTIHNMLKREGISVKRLSKIAKERSAVLRAEYQLQIANYTRDQLVFVDEVA